MTRFNFKRINWRRVILNLRSFAGLSARKVEQLTSVKEAKIYRMASEGNYTVSEDEGHALLDLHYDECKRLHQFNKLVIR